MLTISLLLATLGVAATSSEAASSNIPNFSFDSFAGTYYLDRDHEGVAKLTTQEDMVVMFPVSSSLNGLKRSLPELYQDRSVDLKVISVTDALDNPIRYSSIRDKANNRIIETGQKDIILSGIQTYRIKYQTTGVAASYPDHDELLINVNGRGWDEPFGSVKAFMHVDQGLSDQISAQPTCYIGLPSGTNSNDCTVTINKQGDGVLVSATTTKSLAAHQALVLRIDFQKNTFAQKQAPSKLKPILSAVSVVSALLLLVLGAYKFVVRSTSGNISHDRSTKKT